MKLLHKIGKNFLLFVVITAGFLLSEISDINAQEAVPNETEITTSSSNSENGGASENATEVNIAYTENQVTQNTATIKNNFSIYANTGKNSSDDNIGDVNIETGNSRIEVAVNNIANTTTVVPGCCLASPTPAPSSSPGERITDPVPTSSHANQASLPAGDEIEAGGPSVLGLSDTSAMVEKVTGNFRLIVGLNLITIGIILFIESLNSRKKAINL
jgi:hypothetical protein